ncbi:hypothetical protein CAOG_02055 [Capsaspora owczarzaki ATCC 30864]|uniref:Uncharacterized protein n=1 Tax=Capsaspora owczarzaki (strain ATCC 30864) TaxID=595528 RepID=A0A0D2X1H3_CAPO3|nr:hypothetical protein CAOG_02055 [Capsaspora owczarzaki ATCC 30864]KJE90809.1 hypothetical protein CAOG_002055 [Capsaspora owczarzaki ATCC 30864]|eukprot:XP_004348805.1 hypothetical protein CAOG_02055 [Capsaspora owczarzaki ATCC 30864]
MTHKLGLLVLLLSLACAVAPAAALVYEAWAVDPVSVENLAFIVSDQKPLAPGGVSVDSPVAVINVTSFEGGSNQTKCTGAQLSTGITVAMKPTATAFSPLLRIQSHDDSGFHTLSVGLLGINIPLNFSLQQLSPSAPAIFYPGQTYNVNLSFENTPIDTPVGVKPVCVNLNEHQIVAKVTSLQVGWLYFDMVQTLNTPFYLNVIQPGATEAQDVVVASIKICMVANQCS